MRARKEEKQESDGEGEDIGVDKLRSNNSLGVTTTKKELLRKLIYMMVQKLT